MTRRIWSWVVFLPLLATVVTMGAAVMYLPGYALAVFLGAKMARVTVDKRGGRFVGWLALYSAILLVLAIVATTYLFGWHFKRQWNI